MKEVKNCLSADIFWDEPLDSSAALELRNKHCNRIVGAYRKKKNAYLWKF